MEAIERIVFFGTPAFAVPTLESLVEAGRSPVLVVSQPARGVGRGRRVVQPPVAQFALDHDLELAQPEKVSSKDFLDRLRALEPDLAVVVAFGQIFRQSLLDIPRLGCVNVHASLLPAYRGAAPIVAAVRAGDPTTGVTTMVMERGLDSGPMLLREETPIGPRETGGELTERLATLGGRLLVRTVDALEAGTVEPEEQDHDRATFAPRLEKSEGQVDFGESATRVDAHVRAFDPWPGTFATIAERPLRLLAGRPLDHEVGDAAPGEIVAIADGRVVVACGESTAFGLERVQRPGKKAVSARDWINGERLEPGTTFAPPPAESREDAT